tara:strand:- start:1163 stop:1567 length:405 start_codon:yes stop_codon:yes gene_type:complete
MASKNLTFDPTAGVPYAANLTIFTGSDFTTTFNVVDTSDVAFDFQGTATTTAWSGSAQMQKSAGVAATTVAAGTFTVGFTSAGGGIFEISMGSTATTNLSEGRYEYNVLVSSGSTIYNIVNGNILVYTGIASAP